MAELLLYKEDIWEKTLRKMGFYLGKFIYIMDAYEDLSEDKKKNRYNPLKQISEKEDYEERMVQILRMMIAEDGCYMRDYTEDENGRIARVDFDRIKNT